ncbi:hypothetical protein GCM10010215_08310 [Streptomyces virginiae]|uniref:DUF7380 domain-containing protein n=1 Tax=Streptomyces virginiae TaxID=1961 RepID=A0ABQ3NST6_STRVG|nr:hypothetical protein [Streptomyces virginiae]MBP2345538.1 hypothetical protein [Streptomyces virginiae]GGP85171.1 hypothetical protein GCM10010215_08310 [Streptomyces virginiae]GHI15826.1 hypothetical protein Scinn_52890 [Streptomyces virginiae]
MSDAEPVGRGEDRDRNSRSTDKDLAVYDHDPALVPELARLADEACEGAEGSHEASLRVRRLVKGVDSTIGMAAIRELVITFAYSVAPRPLGSTQPGADLVPLQGPSVPRALREANDQVQSLWIDLASSVTHPLARARCADIVFTLRLVKGREAAENAVQGYLDLVGGSLQLHEQGDGLLRAWGLSQAVGLTSLAPLVSTAMLAMVEGALSRHSDPHVVVQLLDALVMAQRKKNVKSPDPRVDDLLDRALLAYSDTHTISDLASVVRRRAAGDRMRLQHANEVEVKAYLNDADKATSALIARAHLNDAASKARQLGLPDLEAIAVSRLQSAPPVEWKSIQTELKVPNSYFRDFLRPYRCADTWITALGAWFNTDSPSGAYESNMATARNVLNQSIVARLATTILFGHDDLPKRVLSGDDEAFQHELVRVEMIGIQIHGIMLADALDLIKVRFGIPPLGEIEECLTAAGAHPAFCRTLAKSLHLYWVGEFEAAVHLSVPKVEAAARALLLELNEPMYRVAVGDGTGVFPGLGALLDPLLENDFDPDWERFFRAFLLNEGENVRNLAAHGFLDEVSRETAALALRACALLVLITSTGPVDRDRALVKAALAKPTLVLPRSWWQRTVSAVRAARRELLW